MRSTQLFTTSALLLAALASGALFIACGPDGLGGNKEGNRGAGEAPGELGGGSLDPSGANSINFTENGLTPSEQGAVDGGSVIEDEPDPCDENDQCQEGFLCTVANQCGKTLGACTDNLDCEGDTYCCSGDCRKDGAEDGVCVPGNVGPGTECKGEVSVGVFAPGLQCEWKADDAFGSNVATTPLVGDLPNDSGASAEIVFVSFAGDDSNAASKNVPGTLRIIRGDDCRLIETVEDSKNLLRANMTPALADLNNDGKMEIIAHKKDNGIMVFKWDGGKYITDPNFQNSLKDISSAQVWSGISVHNLDDGDPEIIVGLNDKVYTLNGITGATIGTAIGVGGGFNFNGFIPVIADIDNDGKPEMLVNTSGFLSAIEWKGNGWEAAGGSTIIKSPGKSSHYAVADFGTDSDDGFDPTVLDGIAEIVTVEDAQASKVAIYTLGGREVMKVTTSYEGKPSDSSTGWESGGPPVVGDFDNDGFPEVGVAGASMFRVFDLDCASGGDGCIEPYVRWKKPSQDYSSRQTGASIFDFDGDGKAEAVYADECFLRVYDGTTGDVLFSSYRTSGTWYENPVVADPDKDQNTEIIVNSAYEVKCGPKDLAEGTPFVDPLHPGVPCDDDSSCVSGGSCSEGYCRCGSDADCDEGLTCQSPLSGMGNTCRSTHPNDIDATGGIRVLRDRLDRWASSLPIWNQHAYSVTNINVDGSVPLMSEWEPNFSDATMNHYRQNAQGDAEPDDLPDVSGQLDVANLCTVVDNKVVLTGKVCNRGRKAVGAALPATFYASDNTVLCVSYTAAPVGGYGDCRAVSCEVDLEGVSGDVKMVVNDDGMGGRTTVECRDDNNEDSVNLEPMGCIVIK